MSQSFCQLQAWKCHLLPGLSPGAGASLASSDGGSQGSRCTPCTWTPGTWGQCTWRRPLPATSVTRPPKSLYSTGTRKRDHVESRFPGAHARPRNPAVQETAVSFLHTPAIANVRVLGQYLRPPALGSSSPSSSFSAGSRVPGALEELLWAHHPPLPGRTGRWHMPAVWGSGECT